MAIQIGTEITADNRQLDRQMRRGADIVESRMGSAWRRVGRIANGALSNIRGSLRRVFSLGGAIAGGAALFGLDRLVRRSSELNVQLKALEGQTDKTRGEVVSYVRAVSEATGGLLDFKQSAAAANTALVNSIPQDLVARFTRLTSQIAVARGEADEFSQRFPELMAAISGGTPGPLEEFGVRVPDAAIEGVDIAQRRVILLREAISDLTDRAQQMGVTGEEIFFTYRKVFNNITRIVTKLGQAVTQSETFQTVVRTIEHITGRIGEILRDNKVGDALETIFGKIGSIAEALARDTGEAIAVGIGQGIRMGVRMLGFSLTEILGAQQAQRINEFLGRDLFTRTGPATRDAFGQPEQTQATAPRGPFGTNLSPVEPTDPGTDARRTARQRLFSTSLSRQIRRVIEAAGLSDEELRSGNTRQQVVQRARLQIQRMRARAGLTAAGPVNERLAELRGPDESGGGNESPATQPSGGGPGLGQAIGDAMRKGISGGEESNGVGGLIAGGFIDELKSRIGEVWKDVKKKVRGWADDFVWGVGNAKERWAEIGRDIAQGIRSEVQDLGRQLGAAFLDVVDKIPGIDGLGDKKPTAQNVGMGAGFGAAKLFDMFQKNVIPGFDPGGLFDSSRYGIDVNRPMGGLTPGPGTINSAMQAPSQLQGEIFDMWRRGFEQLFPAVEFGGPSADEATNPEASQNTSDQMSRAGDAMRNVRDKAETLAEEANRIDEALNKALTATA